MSSEVEPPPRRVLSLVQYCQRVAASHVDFISGFGDSEDLRYELIEPMLESCSADTLLRLEQSSPYIQKDTCDLWKQLCFKSYPLTKDRYQLGELEEPASWRDQYYILRAAEARRLEEVASRLRSQRMEAEERKKEREVKLTDRLPPTKRSRTGGSSWSTGPIVKTLFQKTKSEASKLQRTMYTSRMVPPMIQGKRQRVLPGAPSAKPPPASTSSGGELTTRTITYRQYQPHISPSSSTTPLSPHLPNAKISASPEKSLSVPTSPTKVALSSLQLPSLSSETRSSKAPTVPKKDPMASLFMPKHRAHSQLTGKTTSTRTTLDK